MFLYLIALTPKKLVYVRLLFFLIAFNTIATLTLAQVPPAWVWARNDGDVGDDLAHNVATDNFGNVYVAGQFFSSSITFGTATFNNAGVQFSSDVYLVKYDLNGNVLWARNAGGANDDAAYSVACDNAGNVFITGEFFSPTISFGSNTFTNSGMVDIFVVKYDSAGTVMWAQQGIGNDINEGLSLAVDYEGSVLITGTYNSDTLSFGSTFITNSTLWDFFIFKFDSSGVVQWGNTASCIGYDGGYDICCDKDANVYVIGEYSLYPVTFGSTTLNNVGYDDLFIIKYDDSGILQWAKSAGGSDYDDAEGIDIDYNENLFITGEFAGPSCSFGTDTLFNSNPGNWEMLYVAKYDALGNVIWARTSTSPGISEGQEISVDGYGNATIVGRMISPTVTFGTTTLTNAGSDNTIIVNVNASGNFQWALSVQGDFMDVGTGIDRDANGFYYICGSFYSSVDTFGTIVVNNTSTGGYRDLFVAKLDNTVGMSEMNQSNFQIAPNPAGEVSILTLEQNVSNAVLSIIDLNGNVVKEQKSVSGNAVTIHREGLPAGMYFVQITENGFPIATARLVYCN